MRRQVLSVVAFMLFGHAATAQSVDSQFPHNRQLPVLVYDSLRNRLILFGGAEADRRTFAWDGRQWNVVAHDGPRPRDDAAFAYIPEDGSTLVFGGRGVVSPGVVNAFRDLWRFDGSRWMLLADSSGPSGRAHPMGAYDPVRRRFVVFGGAVFGQPEWGPNETDTWEWDGQKWTRFDVPAPPGRTGHVMAFDRKSNMVIVHGGAHNDVPLTDTWGWDGEQWHLFTMAGPRINYGAAATAPDSGIVVFGRNQSATTWYWSGAEWRPITSDGAQPRLFAAMALHSADKRIYMLGGGVYVGTGDSRRYVVQNDLWYLDKDFKWVNVYTR